MRYAWLPLWGLIKRELIRDLRKMRPVIFMSAVLSMAIWMVMANYPGGHQSTIWIGQQSMVMYSAITTVLFFAAIVLLPGYAATAIVVERETDTYDLLSLTLTRPTFIVLGKLISSLAYFLLILVAVLPCIGTTMFLVGIDR